MNKHKGYSCNVKAYEHKREINTTFSTRKFNKDKLKVCYVEYFARRNEREMFEKVLLCVGNPIL